MSLPSTLLSALIAAKALPALQVGAGIPCPAEPNSTNKVVCPDGWSCKWKSGPTGACHFEYPPGVVPHRENCWGCTHQGLAQPCEPNLPNTPLSTTLPNVLVVGDSISHGYFPFLAAALNGTVHLQHAPSNAGTIAAGLSCFNITTRTATGPAKWDAVTFNFGLHDVNEPVPPPLKLNGRSGASLGNTSIQNYLTGLQRYTDRLLATGTKPLFLGTTPFMRDSVYTTIEQMNGNASTLMSALKIPTVDLFSVIAAYCGPLPYIHCDICQGNGPGLPPVDCRTTPHYTDQGYEMLVKVIAPAILKLVSDQGF